MDTSNIYVKQYDRTASDLYVDKTLTNVSIAYKNNLFIADQIAPKVPVKQDTGKIWSYGFENFALKDLERGDYARSKRSSYSVSSSATYDIINYALSDVVTQKMRDQADSPMAPETDTTEVLTQVLALNKEYKLASILFNTGTTGFSGYTEALSTSASRYRWNDYTNSDPIQDSAYARETKIAVNSGQYADISLVIGSEVWAYLEEHPDILERIKYTQAGVLTEELVAKVMKVKNLLVGRARYNTANEGATASLSPVWGKYAAFYYNPPKAGIKTAATIATLSGGKWVRRWVEPAYRNSTVIEVEDAFEHKMLSSKSGYLFSTAVT